MAFVVKLANQNNGVKYLIIAVDIFSTFVIVQKLRTKYANDSLQAFKKRFLEKKNIPEKLSVDKET